MLENILSENSRSAITVAVFVKAAAKVCTDELPLFISLPDIKVWACNIFLCFLFLNFVLDHLRFSNGQENQAESAYRIS